MLRRKKKLQFKEDCNNNNVKKKREARYSYKYQKGVFIETLIIDLNNSIKQYTNLAGKDNVIN